MNLDEYNKVKDYTYTEYCDYLQHKYGIGKCNYMTQNYNPVPKCKRTSDGLVAHHKMEDRAILLSTPKIAQHFPYEWQEAKNIVYCDCLEHLFLHTLICEYPSDKVLDIFDVGIGGIINFITPELNDVYSGWRTQQTWRKNLHDKIINDKDVYMLLLKRVINGHKEEHRFKRDMLERSLGDMYGGWDSNNNTKLYDEIEKL